MAWDEATTIDLLRAQNYVTEEDIARASKGAQTGRGSALDFLFAEGLVTKDLVGQAIAESLKVPYADLNSHPPTREQVQQIPASVGLKRRLVLFAVEGRSVVVATDNPEQSGIKSALKGTFGSKSIKVAYAAPEDIEESLLHYRPAITERIEKLSNTGGRVAPELVSEIIADAVARHASDVHFEPREGYVELRFRIDGVLHHITKLDSQVYERVLNRIKVLARLRTDEHYAPQDGSIHLDDAGGTDIRVSIVPIFDGEKVVMRLLSRYTRGLALSSLGMLPDHQQQISDAARKPFGMILVTGPTGSGKSTSLYALMKRLNQPEVNIATIEDPVEYRLPGVNHIQVDRAREVTFARGLRSIVRQDPDIILVGEIRDQETAEIAVNAALTGHMLLSTFHANDAATAVPRLLDMGIEPFLLSSTLELIVAQRLVRNICDNCRVSSTVKVAGLKKEYPELKPYLSDTSITLYEGKGCNVCQNTGFTGRTGVFELIQITPEIESLVLQDPNASAIWQMAANQGARSMFEDGLEKVKAGITTIPELLRVVAPPEQYGKAGK